MGTKRISNGWIHKKVTFILREPEEINEQTN